MPRTTQTPSLDLVRDYLATAGWAVQSEGVAGTLVSNGRAVIGVPFHGDDVLTWGVIRQIAAAERKSADKLAQRIRYLHHDVAYLRAANDRRIVDAIPFETGAKIISSARTMLRSTATTAQGLRGQIGTSFSRKGDGVIKQSLMGHTEKGSYVIPVLIPVILPEAGSPNDQQPEIESLEVHRVAAEPFERRVMRTFAESLEAIRSLAVEPATDPTTDQVHELVYRGVSREFCVALAQILRDPAVAEFGAAVLWTPTIPAPPSLPAEINIDAEAEDLVQRVAKKLRTTKIEPTSVFTGTIVEMRHEVDDLFGEIAVATIRAGRPSEVRVRLKYDDYKRAWAWHHSGQSVIVEGQVKRVPGKRLSVESPRRCEPVENTQLPEAVAVAGALPAFKARPGPRSA